MFDNACCEILILDCEMSGNSCISVATRMIMKGVYVMFEFCNLTERGFGCQEFKQILAHFLRKVAVYCISM